MFTCYYNESGYGEKVALGAKNDHTFMSMNMLTVQDKLLAKNV